MSQRLRLIRDHSVRWTKAFPERVRPVFPGAGSREAVPTGRISCPSELLCCTVAATYESRLTRCPFQSHHDVRIQYTSFVLVALLGKLRV